MEDSALVRTCAAIGRFFHMDPVAVAGDGYFRYAFRVAAFNYQSEVERKRAEEEKTKDSASK